VLLFLLAAALVCDSLPAGFVASSASLEYNVKAAFLLNFTRFVDWPPATFTGSDSPLTICILGDDPFGRAIDQIAEGESTNRHKITVERIRADQPKSCQVLYIPSGKPLPAAFIATPSAVLTVGEGEDFLRQGGIIAFALDNGHVRFDVNLKAASNAGLKLSSKLLSVARSIER